MSIATPAVMAAALEEIIVTARKREEAIQDIPVAVTAVTGEMLERSALINFEEASAVTPGFQVRASGNSPQAPYFSIRGSVQNEVIVTSDPSVGIYVDDVYIARPWGVSTDLLDLQSVQVLKGPQGTLFGRNSTAGAVLLQTNDPILEEFSGTVSLTEGTDDSRQKVILNVPLGDKFAFRVAHQNNERDDYVDNLAQNPNNPLYTQYNDTIAYAPTKTTNTKIGGYENTMTRAKILFAPIDGLEMVISYEDYEANFRGSLNDTTWLAGQSVPHDPGDDTRSLNFDPHSYADTETYIFTLDYSSDIGEIKFVASRRDFSNYNEVDYDGGDYAAPPWDLSALYGYPAGSIVSVRRHGSWGRMGGEQDLAEIQFTTALFDDNLDLTTGVNYFNESAVYYDYSQGNSPYEYGVSAGGNWVRSEIDGLGFYAQGSYHIDNLSNLTVGVRRSDEEKSALIWGSAARTGITQLPSWDFDAYRNSLVATSGDLIVREPSKDFTSTDWLVSYDRKISDTVLVFAKASTGYRSGGFNGRGADDPNESLVFQPEEIIEYELGIKADLLDGKLRWNTSIYMNETEGKQFTVLVPNSVPGAPPGTNIRNAGEAEAQGFEMEVTYLLTDNLNVAATYGYIDSEITSLATYNPESGRVEEVPKNRLPNVIIVPENEWSLTLNYDREFNNLLVRASALYAWTDEMVFVAETAAEIDFTNAFIDEEQAQGWVDGSTSEAYGMLNLTLTFSSLDEKYNLTFWGKNVLDERAHRSSHSFISGQAYQYASANYTEPSTFGATATVKF